MSKNKKEALTYGLFIKTVDTLTAEGQTPSVRAVRSRIGGSNSTLMEYLQRWRHETSSPTLEDDTVSEPFKQALRAEMGRVIRITRESVETQLTEEKKQAEEARSLLSETEARLEELETQHQTEREEAEQKLFGFDKQLATCDGQIVELRRQLEKLESQLEEVTRTAHQMEIRAVVAESRIIELEKSANKK